MVNRLGGLSLPRKSVVRLTDRPDMTLDVYHGCKKTIQQHITYIINCGQNFHPKLIQYTKGLPLILFLHKNAHMPIATVVLLNKYLCLV